MIRPSFDVRIRVPASSGNLGPGFDALGLSLALFTEVRLRGLRSGPRVSIRNEGEGADRLPTDRTHLVFRAVEECFREAGRLLPKAMEIEVVNRIPLSRGLGSSSSALVAGLTAANEALGRPFSKDRLLFLAARREGHPDNAAPSLFGGLVVSVMEKDRVVSLPWKDRKMFGGLRFVAAVPDFELPTVKARAILPKQVFRADAVHNVGRAALLLSALQFNRPDLFAVAFQDRLHQPWRKQLVPGFDEVIGAAVKAGSHGAWLSGAGPTILAASPSGNSEAVGRAMAAAFKRRRISCRVLILRADLDGVRRIR